MTPIEIRTALLELRASRRDLVRDTRRKQWDSSQKEATIAKHHRHIEALDRAIDAVTAQERSAELTDLIFQKLLRETP